MVERLTDRPATVSELAGPRPYQSLFRDIVPGTRGSRAAGIRAQLEALAAELADR
jgi:hypothetical protein